MKTALFVAAGYLALVGIAGIWSNVGTNTPTADSFAALPSVGAAFGAGSASAQAGINLASAAALAFVVPRFI
jgi:hypothetical protein